VVQTPATVVTVGLTLAGDVASFGPVQQADLKASLQTSLSCKEPACFLAIRLRAASISVETILTIPQAAAMGPTTSSATPSTTVAAVQAAANALVTSPPAAISSALGVAVTSADPAVSTQSDVVVPLAVAPPPPSPPPSVPSPSPPSVPPLAALPTAPVDVVANLDGSQAQSADSGSGNGPSNGLVTAIVGGGAGVVLLVLLVGVSYRYRSRWLGKHPRSAAAASKQTTATLVGVVSHTFGSETSAAAGASEFAEIECAHSSSGGTSTTSALDTTGLHVPEEKV
jgi:hypothetical protein